MDSLWNSTERKQLVAIKQTTYLLVHRELSQSESHTLQFAAAWAQELRPGDVVAFYGRLGSGKTTFIRGLVAGLGARDTVSSPTFTLVNVYRGRHQIFHLDLYRLHQASELRDVGVEEYLAGDGICVVEWPEIIQPWLPIGHHAIRLSHDFDGLNQDTRLIEVLQHHDSRH